MSFQLIQGQSGLWRPISDYNISAKAALRLVSEVCRRCQHCQPPLFRRRRYESSTILSSYLINFLLLHPFKENLMRIIDLSVCLEAGLPTDPLAMRPEITYRDHAGGAAEFAATFPGLRPEDLPDHQGAAIEWLRLTTHNGTHLDAPWHFHSTMNNGERSWTIDEVPLEWCVGDGV